MLSPEERLKQLKESYPDLKVVQLPKTDGSPSNTAVVVDGRAEELKGAVIVRGGGKRDCDPKHYKFVVGRTATV